MPKTFSIPITCPGKETVLVLETRQCPEKSKKICGYLRPHIFLKSYPGISGTVGDNYFPGLWHIYIVDIMEYLKKNIWVIIAVAVLVALAVVYFILRGRKKTEPPVSSPIPQVEIQNNPLKDKVPDPNPIIKTNPFKYQNPLR